ncbi:MAG: hypothetical protein DYG96_11100 [Chlorobi bacterium CHB2]|nr:hypothetical protein [Chlorobi bacterium CHB2]
MATANAANPLPASPNSGEGLETDDPNNSEQPIFLEIISHQHWGDAKPLATKQGGVAMPTPAATNHQRIRPILQFGGWA